MHSADNSKTGQPPGIASTFAGFFAFRNEGIESNFERGTWPARHPERSKANDQTPARIVINEKHHEISQDTRIKMYLKDAIKIYQYLLQKNKNLGSEFPATIWE